MLLIPDKDVYKTKLDQLDLNRVHVVADFDKTLTKAFYDGRKHHSSIALVRDGHYLSPEYVQKSHALFDRYHPIEVDPSRSIESKTVAMQQWWGEHWELMVKSGMSRSVIDDIVGKDIIHAREGLKELLGLLQSHDIPLLILSAGIGNIIEAFLKRNDLLTSNIRIISNFFEFDKSGISTGYSKPMIHAFNKNEAQVNADYLKNRDQVIVIGDSLGDLRMTANTKHSLELKVGFANRADHQVPFSKHFDVVITGDGPITPITEILHKIISK